MHKEFCCFLSFTLFLIAVCALAQPAALPDFSVDAASITFSNPSPLEGEEIIIRVAVKNVGEAASTRNEDLVVNLYEGNPYVDDPAKKPLRILCRDAILGLPPGKSDSVKTAWRPPPGTVEVYAVVNPAGDTKEIREDNRENNIAHTSITSTPRAFPKATPAEIQASIQKGVEWVKAQQGKHSRTCVQCGTENQLISICVICGATLKGLPEDRVAGPAWDFGEDSRQETAIALLTLLSAGVPVSDPVVQGGLEFLTHQDMNSLQVYQLAIIVPALVAANDLQYRRDAQFAVNQLVRNQLPVKGDEFRDPRDDGGWGYGTTADGAHMHMVIYALYAAKQWGLDIPQDTWERAEKWIRRNQMESGGWVYNLVDSGSPWAEGVYGSMTGTGLWALRACGVPAEDPQIRKGQAWVKKYWSLTRNPGSTSWHYYYLVSLQRFCDIPPKLQSLAGHDWYQEISNMLVAEQQPDGRWIDHEDYFPTTCFALMFLTRALPRPTSPNLGAVYRSVRFSPPAPRVGEPVRISVTLTNTGIQPEESIVNVDFYDGNPERGGKKIGDQEVIFRRGLEETTTTINWVPTEKGAREIYVLVDPDKQIDDLDRENNAVSQALDVRPKSAAAIDSTPTTQKISDGVYRLGEVTVDFNKREVTVPGEINIISGDTILEFFAVGKFGKTHESLIMVHAEPFYIQLALIELGMTPGMNLTIEGDPHEPKGDSAEVWIEWERGTEVVRHRAEKLVWNAFNEHPMQQTRWVFTGGRIINNQFTAQRHHNIIAVYRDPDSIFNHPLSGGKDDRTYRVNTDAVPSKGTPVKVIIRPMPAETSG